MYIRTPRSVYSAVMGAMSRFDVWGGLWICWGALNILCYGWLHFYFKGGIAYRLEKRVEGSLWSKLIPSTSAIQAVADVAEWSDYQRFYVIYQRWWWIGCVGVPAVLIAGIFVL